MSLLTEEELFRIAYRRMMGNGTTWKTNPRIEGLRDWLDHVFDEIEEYAVNTGLPETTVHLVRITPSNAYIKRVRPENEIMIFELNYFFETEENIVIEALFSLDIKFTVNIDDGLTRAHLEEIREFLWKWMTDQ